MADDDRTWQGFLRQRRNLFAVSLLLTFIHAAGLEIQPHQQIAGIGVTLDNPGAIFAALWIGWGYWFIRYIQYYNDIGEKGFLNTYHLKMLALAHRIAFKQVRQRGLTDWSPPLDGKYKLTSRGETTFRYRSTWRYVIDFPVSAKPIDDHKEERRLYNYERYEVNQRWPLAVAHVRAWLYVIFRTRLFSEYILPYFVALLPLGYLAYERLAASSS